MTLLPVEGFNRSDRSRVRPVAPDADLSNWIKRGARPGLPEIKPAPIAIAPVTRDGQRNRIAIPSNEIIHRPVVTRNRPSDSQVTVNPPRERRLITPRAPVMSNDEPAQREKKVRTDEQRMKPPTMVRPTDGQNSNPSYEKPNRGGGSGVRPRILPAERVDGDNTQSERKAKRGNETTVQPTPDNGSGNDSSNERHKRPVYTPQPKQDNSANDDDTRMRERKARDEEQNRQRDEERARQRNEERQRQNAEERARQRDEEQNRQRDQERARQRDEEQTRQRDAERQRRNDEERARQQQQEERQRRGDEERAKQRNEERQREKPPEHNTATPRQEQPKPPRSEPAREERRQQKQERRAEQEQRKKS